MARGRGKHRPRKTFNSHQKKKRKSNYDNIDREIKRQKVEQNPIKEESSESEEEENYLKKILESYDPKLKYKRLQAIESSDDSTDEDNESDVKINKSFKDSEISEDEVKQNDAEEELSEDDNEQQEEEIEEDPEKTVSDDNVEDPFVKHLFYELHQSLLNSVESSPQLIDNHEENWPHLGRLLIKIPQQGEIQDTPKSKFSITEKTIFAPKGTVPKKIDVKSIVPSDLFIKSQIVNNLSKANYSLSDNQVIFTELQAELFSIINNYQDLYYSERTFSNAEEIRFVYCLHAVNHILKTRIKIIHHNTRLNSLNKKDDAPEEFRDQGLVRPKILIIVPFKDSAYKIIRMIISILFSQDKGNVMKKKRFIDEYTGNEIVMPKKHPKPEDYELTFTGNPGDDFRIGMTVTKKSLKLYADFYSSDIIVASPLGLRTIIGAEGETQRDYDFLASIELLILDQTELFLMQNWDHLNHIFSHLHLQPRESHGTDFSRARQWSLDGLAKYYRQTLIFSSIVTPEINSIFNKECNNYAGKVRVSNQIDFGSIGQVFVKISHCFRRFAASSIQQSFDNRFEFFKNKILPDYKDDSMKQTLIFVTNYFDYVMLRNYFKREDIGFVQICEYSKEGKVARARDMFFHGNARFMLYTERYHFFNRINLKGIRHLIFYQPPIFPHFYEEMCNLMKERNMNRKVGSMSHMSITVIYCKYDALQLAEIVGTERAIKMTQSDKEVYIMTTGSN